MARYVATNIRLPLDRFKKLKRAALRENKSCAQIVREALDVRLGLQGPALGGSSEADPIAELIGFIEGEAGDEALNHDHYLYGAPKGPSGNEETVRRHRGVARGRGSR